MDEYGVAVPVPEGSEEYERISDEIQEAQDNGFVGTGGGEFEVGDDIQEENTQDSAGEYDGAGDGNGENADQGEIVPGDDSGGSAADGGTSAGIDGQGTESAGDKVTVIVDGQPLQVEVTNYGEYEYVSVEQFEQFEQEIGQNFEAANALLVVLAVGIFVSAGIAAVDTLIRSLERY